MSLSKENCIPCRGGIPPLSKIEASKLKKQIHADWKLTNNNTRLHRKLTFKDFKSPMNVLILIGKMAEQQGHHPELSLGWGHLDIEVWTHKINGLTESDFIFAAKVDEILR